MRRTRTACMVAGMAAVFWPVRGLAKPEGPPLVVLFETAPGELPEGTIRDDIARELNRPVRSASEPGLPTVTVTRGATGEILVRYRPPASELERKVPVSAHAEQLPVLVAFIAKNLVSNEARDLMAELDMQKGAAPEAKVGAKSEPGSRLYLRFSLSGGYWAAAYSTTSTPAPATRGVAHKVGLSGAEVGLHVAFGSMSSSGFAFGVEASGGPVFLEQHGSLGGTSIDRAFPLQLGGFVDYYPERRGPLHLQGGLAAAYTGFAAATANAPPSTTSGVLVESLFGAMGYLGAGYDVGPQGTGGFGLFARSHFGFFADGSANLAPISLRLGVSMAWL